MAASSVDSATLSSVDHEPKHDEQSGVSKQLACTNCRRKKVKVSLRGTFHFALIILLLTSTQCQPGRPGGKSCALCTKLGRDCYVPEHDDRRRAHTRRLLADLQAENQRLKLDNNRLKGELEEHWNFCVSRSSRSSDGFSLDSPKMTHDEDDSRQTLESPQPSSTSSTKSDNMIMRLCDGQRQLNSDRVGRLRFFGPTSSLHLRESVTSSLLIQESSGATRMTSSSWQDDFPLELQSQLFDLYWTYQHQVLPW